MQETLFLFGIAILIMSVVLHEVSHGYVADILGDPTARFAGRLTLNPLKHLDLFGSVVVPLVTFFSTGFIFGWARPVPYNPYNLRQRFGPGMVALAGPLSNIIIALLFAVLIRVNAFGNSTNLLEISSFVVMINLLLGFFNLVPIPPLDGSKVFASFLPRRFFLPFSQIEAALERYSLIILFVFIFFFLGFLSSLVRLIFTLLTGIPA